MALQTSVGNIPVGFPGGKISANGSAITYINDAGLQAQTTDIVLVPFAKVAQIATVSVPASPTQSVQTYTVVLNGVSSSYVSGATPTQGQISAGLLAALQANFGTVNSAFAFTGGSTNIVITAAVAGAPFTSSVSQSGGTAITLATTTANFGQGTVYSFSLSNANVATQTVSYTCVLSDSTSSVRDGLINAMRAAGVDGIGYANPAGLNVRLVSNTPGLAFTLTPVLNCSTAAVLANVASSFVPFGFAVVKRTGANSNDKSASLPTASGQFFLGIAQRDSSAVDPMLAGTSATNALAYPPFRAMTVGYRGRWYAVAETAVAVGDPVYFRTASGANGTQPGAFGNVSDSGTCDLVATARWMSSTTSTGQIAEIELALP
jgi:hypothetical protein